MTRDDLKDWWKVTWVLRRLILLLVGAYLVRYSNWEGLGFALCIAITGELLLGKGEPR